LYKIREAGVNDIQTGNPFVQINLRMAKRQCKGE